MTTTDKTYEKRIRRMAQRQRMRIKKARRRDPHAWDYGTYMLIDDDLNCVVLAHANGYGCSLEQIEEHLTGGTR